MLARRPEEAIPRLRPGISIKQVMIAVFFRARSLIALDSLPKGQKDNQENLVQNILPSLRNEKKPFSGQKTAIKFSVQLGNSICHNGHQVVDELHRLKILRAPYPRSSPNISPCDFWMFGDLKGGLKDRHLQGLEEILMAFQELRDKITFEELQMTFESWRDRLRWILEHDGEHFRQ
jgi:hypothetical protein